VEIAEKVIGKALDDAEQKRLVDSFIDELGDAL
jgi:F0F1-type ATP synthase membrane subunit b/b'